jgi:hypothetical protein
MAGRLRGGDRIWDGGEGERETERVRTRGRMGVRKQIPPVSVFSPPRQGAVEPPPAGF